MSSQCYFLEVDEDICFKAPDDSVSNEENSPLASPRTPACKTTPCTGQKRPALQSIDQNVATSPPKPMDKTPLKIYNVPKEEQPPQVLREVEYEDREALKGATNSTLATEQTPNKATNSKPSFISKLLAWGSSTKYPPRTPVVRNSLDDMDTEFNRILGEVDLASTVAAPPDYLVSPPRDPESNQNRFVNRDLFGKNDAACLADVGSIEQHGIESCSSFDEAVVSLALPCDQNQQSPEESTDRRRSSGVGTLLQSSMTQAAALLQRSQCSVSEELAMVYEMEDNEHVPVYSKAELESTIEKIRRDFENEYKEKLEIELRKNQDVLLRIECVEPQAHRSLDCETEKSSSRLVQLERDLEMQRMQTSALLHQIKVMNEEIVGLNVNHQKDMEKRAVETEEKVRSLLGAEMKELASKLARADASIADCKIVIDGLHDTIKKMKDKEGELELSKQKAVSEAKAKIYQKAQKQFEEGNKEYQRVMKELQDTKDRIVASNATIANLTDEKKSMTDRVSAGDKELVRLKEVHCLNEECINQSVARLETMLNLASSNTSPIRDRLIAVCSQVESAFRSIQSDNDALLLKRAEFEKEQIRLAEALDRSEASLKAADILSNVNHKRCEAAEAEKMKQMELIGKVLLEKTLLEEKLSSLQLEHDSCNERNCSLRAMNEELLQMLEANMPAQS